MKQYFNICVLGGDARHVHVINRLAENDVTIYPVGFDQITFTHEKIIHKELDKCPFEKIDAIFLPLSGTNKDGTIISTYSKKPLHLTRKILEQTPEHCTVFTGAANVFLQDIIEKENRKIIRLFANDDAAIQNSIPTAEGALQIAMEETSRTIHDSNILILGYGRIGQTVSHIFHAVGGNVTVTVRNPGDLARAKQLKYKTIPLENIKESLAKQQIIINTIPKHILNETLISELDKDSLIIDLVSAPGGTDFDFANTKGIKAIHALGLPGIVAPTTAGEQIATILLEWMENKDGELD